MWDLPLREIPMLMWELPLRELLEMVQKGRTYMVPKTLTKLIDYEGRALEALKTLIEFSYRELVAN